MNDATTTQATSPAQSDADALIARQLNHVGAAYALVFVVVLAWMWRAGSRVRQLSSRVEELESELRRRR